MSVLKGLGLAAIISVAVAAGILMSDYTKAKYERHREEAYKDTMYKKCKSSSSPLNKLLDDAGGDVQAFKLLVDQAERDNTTYLFDKDSVKILQEARDTVDRGISRDFAFWTRLNCEMHVKKIFDDVPIARN
ncbi:MAG: hypothetical protein B0A82_19980 [Alkalinema sp. CACIAM 70d]|nr:MAG: hypothetical protein B0A82_19980 [Alkalinema sp. CACIAM 70d]